LTLLVYLVAPEYLLDIPTSYMLKNDLHATAPQVSLFRLLTGIPMYLAFLPGLARDLWNPFGLRDRGFFLLFAPLTACVFVWMGVSGLSYRVLVIGMILVMLSFRFLLAAYQGLIALVGQELLMSGRLSTLSSMFYQTALILAAFASGIVSESLSPRQTFFMMAALAASLGLFGVWRPQFLRGHVYGRPQAQGSNLRGDVRRLLKHRAIYPAVLISFLWWFNPGLNTPVQFYLTNQLHASDATYSNFLGIFAISFIPTYLLYGLLCTRLPAAKLLWWGTIVAVPQMVPLAFVHSGNLALALAVPMGLMGGMATAAYFDLAMRSCPPGLQGTLMMLVLGGNMLAARGGDLLGAKIYAGFPTQGFLYCVIATTAVYALILPVILWVPKHIIATADGVPNPEVDAEVAAEIGAAPSTKVALITGASSGIGAASAELLANRGYVVYGSSRNPNFKPTGFRPLHMDVRDDESVNHAVARVLQEAGRIDVLINNAGCGLAGAVEDTTTAEALHQIDVNFMGPFRLAKAVLPAMRRRRSGLIVNVSSLGGLFGLPFQSFYSASKFALEGFTESLRYEVSRYGIRVVLIEPGDVQTGFTGSRVVAAAASGSSAYAGPFSTCMRIIEKEEKNGVAPARIAQTICRIVEGDAAGPRYTVGAFSQRLSAVLKILLPGILFETIIGSFYGLDSSETRT
jgi:NAD(P)-dependent dehydrogenase (short-subunit alcohol dehydrogenase family)